MDEGGCLVIEQISAPTQVPEEELGDKNSPLLEVRVTRALYRDKQDVMGQIVDGGVETGVGTGGVSAGGTGIGGVGSGLGGIGLMDGSSMTVPSLPPPPPQTQMLTGDVFHLQVTQLHHSCLYINPHP